MFVVEIFLNISWVAICITLLMVCVRGERRGALRLSLPLALAASLLVALLLFPAISMSDDLQSISFDVEHPRRSLELLSMADLVQGPVATLMMLWTMLALLCIAIRRVSDQPKSGRRFALAPATRPDAVRPPPFAFAV